MKPVFQTAYGEGKGNCYAACVASVLELPLEVMPDLITGVKCRRDQDNILRNFLKMLGWGIIALHHDALRDPDLNFRDRVMFFKQDGYYIAGGVAENGVGHAVVMKDGQLAHNPHEGWGELTEIKEYVIFYPLDNILREKPSEAARIIKDLEQCHYPDGTPVKETTKP